MVLGSNVEPQPAPSSSSRWQMELRVTGTAAPDSNSEDDGRASVELASHS
jgi:hypothetical protein